MDSRRNVRAAFCTQVSLRGTDRSGKPFRLHARTIDFSRRGIGLVIDKDAVAPGSIISVDIPKRLNSCAVVQWSRPDRNGNFRVGLKLLHVKASLGLRLLCGALLCLALVGQPGFGRSRAVARAQRAGYTCTMSLERMKNLLQGAFSGYAVVSESDKAFLHIQHERLGCEEYTRLYEKSDFYDERTRAALAHWHWTVYHGGDEALRAAELRNIQALLQSVH